MGGDGGSIPKRADMVKTKGYSSAQGSSVGSMGYNPNSQRRVAEEHVDPKKQRQLWMTRCWLTGQNFNDEPIAACRAGYLYSKETVVRYLLEKQVSRLPKHITSIRDIVDVKFKKSALGRIVCPITGKELDDGVHKSSVIWPCGCVVSTKALTLESGERTACINCGTAGIESVIKLYPEEKDEQERQLGKAYESRHKKGVKILENVAPLKRKAQEDGMEKLKQTRVYDKIFHSSRS